MIIIATKAYYRRQNNKIIATKINSPSIKINTDIIKKQAEQEKEVQVYTGYKMILSRKLFSL